MSTLEMNQPERVQAAFANLPPDYFADKDAFKFRFYVLDDIVHTGDDSFVPYDDSNEADIINIYENLTDVAIYVHSPWCKSRCTYCYYHQAQMEPEPKLRRLIQAEQRHALLLEEKIGLKSKNVPSIYFGGGTPTALPDALLEENLAFFVGRYGGDACEVCLEASPYTLTPQKVEILARYVNRLSIGIQSFDSDLLRILGRKPVDEKIEDLLRDVVGRFPSVNIDLICGLPEQTSANWLDSIQKGIDLGITSITAYRLELREGTPIVRSYMEKPEQFPDEIMCQEMYLQAKEMLLRAGYRENLVGWFLLPQVADTTVYRERWEKQTPCIAFGPAVHNYGADHFYDTLADRDAYIAAVDAGKFPIQRIGRLNVKKQLVWYALAQWKSNRPLYKNILRNRFGEEKLQWFMGLIQDHLAWRTLIESDETVEITETARAILDWILGDIINNGFANNREIGDTNV